MFALRQTLKADNSTRTVAPEATISNVRGLARTLGVTRLADITGLDRLGIPTFSAIVPHSADAISIYNGKGVRRADAMAGALMEAIERQSALNARPFSVIGSVAGMRQQGPILEPAALVTRLAENYGESRPYEWVEGYDLLHDAKVLVPAGLVGYFWNHLACDSPISFSTSHGLASGNCIEEAIAQALCEWVERDAWTLAELGSHWRPRAVLESAMRRDPGADFDDDMDYCPCVDLTGIGEPVEGLLRKFERARLRPVVRDLTSDLGIPVILAAIGEEEVPGFPQAHMGVGAHPEVRVAVARALAEAAQSRAGDIQAVREDVDTAEGEGAVGLTSHTRRVKTIDRRRWIHGRSSKLRSWREIPNHRNADIRDDIDLLLNRLRKAGVPQVAVVDLSPPDAGVAVVRVLVPGLETWITDHGRFGERAVQLWRGLNRKHG